MSLKIERGFDPTAFRKEVRKLSGEMVDRCLMCAKCSSGCVISPFMDYKPHEIIKLILIGKEEKVLSSKAIWLCVGCEACTSRCPEKIDVAKVMDTLRKMALEKGYKPGEKSVYRFHKAFLDAIQKYGRIFELGFMMDFYRKDPSVFKNLTDNIDLGFGMFSMGKLALKPHMVSDKLSVRRAFDKASRFLNEEEK